MSDECIGGHVDSVVGTTTGVRLVLLSIERRAPRPPDTASSTLGGSDSVMRTPVSSGCTRSSVDKRKTCSLNEAESPHAIRRAAALAGMPANVITEVESRNDSVHSKLTLKEPA